MKDKRKIWGALILIPIAGLIFGWIGAVIMLLIAGSTFSAKTQWRVIGVAVLGLGALAYFALEEVARKEAELQELKERDPEAYAAIIADKARREREAEAQRQTAKELTKRRELSPVSQVGYFKSSANDRVFTARLSKGGSESDARAFAESKAYTEGQMTAVYIYSSEATIPADGITNASSVFDANEVLDYPGMSSWNYAFMRYRNGQVEFVDCERTQSTLCR
jgi:hypothetical protein